MVPFRSGPIHHVLRHFYRGEFVTSQSGTDSRDNGEPVREIARASTGPGPIIGLIGRGV